MLTQQKRKIRYSWFANHRVSFLSDRYFCADLRHLLDPKKEIMCLFFQICSLLDGIVSDNKNLQFSGTVELTAFLTQIN
jgi:hypothetical protein